MMAIYGPLRLILDAAFFIMVVHIIFSWLISFQILNLRQPFVTQLWLGLNKLLEPIYTPIRNILPDTRPLDLAPLVAFVILISLRDYILPELLLRQSFNINLLLHLKCHAIQSSLCIMKLDVLIKETQIIFIILGG